jgi:hypothetical protein
MHTTLSFFGDFLFARRNLGDTRSPSGFVGMFWIIMGVCCVGRARYFLRAKEPKQEQH